MAAVSHLTNELRQMLYNFGYRTHFAEEGQCVVTLSKVEGEMVVSGQPQATRLDALLQAYLTLLYTLNEGQSPPTATVQLGLQLTALSNETADQLGALLAHEGYQTVFEADQSGYGWRAAIFRHGKPLVTTDYAATKFDAITHSMGFLVERLEARRDPLSAVVG